MLTVSGLQLTITEVRPMSRTAKAAWQQAVVELEALADAVGPVAQDDDPVGLALAGLALVAVGAVEVGREALELRAQVSTRL